MSATCQVTVYDPTLAKVQWQQNAQPCGQPLAEGAAFCISHEADRLRLIHPKPRRNGRGGPDQERRYSLTRKGWIAALLAEHPSLGETW